MDEDNSRPKWLDMIPVKKYAHFTRFFKPTGKGDGYYVCIQNSEIDVYEAQKEDEKWHRLSALHDEVMYG